MLDDSESSIEYIECFKSLDEELTVLKEQCDFLLNTLDSIQRSLEQDSFKLAEYKIQVAPIDTAVHIRELLNILDLDETNVTFGSFLSALNTYLIHNELIDLNDLQIVPNTLLKKVFYKVKDLDKCPYGLLLNCLHVIFI
jgi:hypothetical protein